MNFITPQSKKIKLLLLILNKLMKNFSFFFHKSSLWIFLLFAYSLFSQQKLIISGKVSDGKNFEIPYAAVGIMGKYIGTSTTEDGSFSFIITNKELSDTLKISSLGASATTTSPKRHAFCS